MVFPDTTLSSALRRVLVNIFLNTPQFIKSVQEPGSRETKETIKRPHSFIWSHLTHSFKGANIYGSNRVQHVMFACRETAGKLRQMFALRFNSLQITSANQAGPEQRTTIRDSCTIPFSIFLLLGITISGQTETRRAGELRYNPRMLARPHLAQHRLLLHGLYFYIPFNLSMN